MVFYLMEGVYLVVCGVGVLDCSRVFFDDVFIGIISLMVIFLMMVFWIDVSCLIRDVSWSVYLFGFNILIGMKIGIFF